MAKDKLTDYDSTASNNLDVGGISVAEGMLPSGVNNAIRELMSHQADAFGAGTPLYVDQTNNRLGVGNAAPTTALDVTGTVTADGILYDAETNFSISSNGGTILDIDANNNGAENLWITHGGGNDIIAKFDTTGDISFYEDTGTTAKLFWDASAERLGVGTTSPSYALQVGDYASTTQASFALASTTAGTCNIRFGDGTSGTTASRGRIEYDHSDDSLAFWTVSAERMRISNNGHLLVGTTDTSTAAQGFRYRDDISAISSVADSGTAAFFGRRTSDGEIVRFRKDSTTVGSIGSNGGAYLFIGSELSGSNPSFLRFVPSSIPSVRPASSTGSNKDNSIDLGSASARFDDVYATNGTIQTSDANEKQQIASLTDAEIRAAKAISAGFKTFKWNDAVEQKGDNARTHTGVIAQEVQAALEAEGLDAGKYAFWMSNTLWETQTEVPAVEAVDAVLDEDGNVVTEAVEAQEAYTRTDTYDTAEEAPEGATERTRLGIRYPELLAFVGAATEQRLANIETRLAALEAN